MDMQIIDKRLVELGITLPPAPAAAGNYLPFRQSGRTVYVSGMLSLGPDGVLQAGQLGRDLTLEQGYEAARCCALNTLAILRQAAGGLENVSRLLLVSGFVNAVAGFSDSPAVINGASDLFVAVLGDAGAHARAAVAVAGLPKNAAVEIQVTAELKSAAP